MLTEILKSLLVMTVLAYFFYRSIWAMIPLVVVGILYFRTETHKKLVKAREELTVQFKECIQSVAANMKAGYAVENAFMESRSDMKLLYGESSLIYLELEGIRRGLVINITLEEMLESLADRSGSDDIRQFAQVFAIAKRGGGNLSEVIQTTVELIGKKIDARKEIQTILSGRRLEQTIMKLMPFGILLYIGCSYPGYFDRLYHNWQGVAIMTICLLVYLLAYVMGDRILQKIEREME